MANTPLGFKTHFMFELKEKPTEASSVMFVNERWRQVERRNSREQIKISFSQAEQHFNEAIFSASCLERTSLVLLFALRKHRCEYKVFSFSSKDCVFLSEIPFCSPRQRRRRSETFSSSSCLRQQKKTKVEKLNKVLVNSWEEVSLP